MISASEIRRSFLDYFAGKDHEIVPSSSLIPKDDPSLLFTNAGMVQFKKIFLGQEKRPYDRAVTSQKCLRVGGKHNDLENVGRTARHHTFFEMLGNFSFGDYFKEEAIAYAWEYLTRDLGLPKDRLYITIFRDDDEAGRLWKKVTGISGERIYRLGEKENFWSMGDTGPCGPCSEVHIDQGEHMACSPDCEIGVCECDRFLEIWNLVFMQFNRDESGNLTNLPKPSIDTGLGLERIAAVCQGVYSNYDTDLFSGLIQSAAYKAGLEYGQDRETDVAFRVIADHSRSVPFMIADGILPSNEGRGYVLRRLIRRAYRYGRSLGFDSPFLYETCGQLVGEMGESYPELQRSEEFMVKVVRQEEENFSKTLDKGLHLLESELRALEKKGERVVPGAVIFKLYDTFGFPIDIVRDLTEKRELDLDESGFTKLMQSQRERSKAAWAGSGEVDPGTKFASLLGNGLQTEFVGYDTLQSSSRIIALLSLEAENKAVLEQGETGYLITASTPFYGESGGQVGDRGKILSNTGLGQVKDTLKPGPDLTVHLVHVEQGRLTLEEEANLRVDQEHRLAVARNHTCTHLLHAALRSVLGKHVKQSGSLVASDRLRFDFTHINPVSRQELEQVEDYVNEAVLADMRLKTRVIPFQQAREEEAIGIFTEKYQDEVRVVEIPGWTKELCGGTHLENTARIGGFSVLSETGIAAGIRRIEAATGWNFFQDYRKIRQRQQAMAAELKTRPEELPKKVSELQEQLKKTRKEFEALQSGKATDSTRDLLSRAEDVQGTRVLAAKVDLPDGAGMKGLRLIMDQVRSGLQQGVVFLAAESAGKAHLILYVPKELHSLFTAPELIRDLAGEVNGSGGGRPDMAQAGGSDPEGIERALDRIRELIDKKLQQ
ncbi:MAG: alanine--tRNA ligase [Desulfohalobiaceae bacterium]|nr:alanine--tRNA ligase [Desulfohalobiaceae bacterium]